MTDLNTAVEEIQYRKRVIAMIVETNVRLDRIGFVVRLLVFGWALTAAGLLLVLFR